MKKYLADIRVIYADTDAMGIVYHTNYIKWFEVGRGEMLRQMGFPYSRMEAEKIWLPVVAVSCEYKTPAVYDDVLEIRSWISKMKAATIIVAYEIVKKGSDIVAVTGTSKHAVTDHTLKPIKLKKVCPELYELGKESGL